MKIRKHFIIFSLILFGIFLLRFPSLYEPFWYGDEGIFAAVGRNLNLGGTLYQTAWDNKPPMIYLTYGAIFKFFGVSMFSLRLTTAVIVLATAAVIYEIAQAVSGERRALWAMAIFGLLSSLRLIEGNLALTEIYMVLPISLAILISVKRNFDYWSLFLAGGLFAIGSLYKQVGALEAGALGLFLFLYSRSFVDYFKKGLIMTSGFLIPYFLTLGYFASKNLVGEYIFGAYTYYQIYLSESPQYAFFINLAKILPILAIFSYGLWKKRQKEVSVFHLFLLWGAFSFLGSFFSGRTYGHYLIQSVPPLSLILANFKVPTRIRLPAVIFALIFVIPIVVLIKILFTGVSGNPFEQFSYFRNFYDFATGAKGVDEYNNYFDGNVNSIMTSRDYLEKRGAKGKGIYVWGDWPWLYAITDAKNPSRFVTSFHVFGVPYGREEVIEGISKSPPDYIVKPPSSIGYFAEFEKVLEEGYTPVLRFDNVQIFKKNGLL